MRVDWHPVNEHAVSSVTKTPRNMRGRQPVAGESVMGFRPGMCQDYFGIGAPSWIGTGRASVFAGG